MTIRARARTARPAALTAVAAAAAWTAIALAAPAIATGNAAALVAVVAAAFFGAATSRPGPGRRRLRLALTASAGAALLIFLVVKLLLPAVPGFVSTTHPPTYTHVTRLVDPVAESGIFVLLAVALGVDVLRTRIRSRRAAARERRPGYGAGPNEMVVTGTEAGLDPPAPGVTAA
jgi:hypothetical protein